jgi:alanine racemase
MLAATQNGSLVAAPSPALREAPCWLDVDLSAVAGNVRAIRQELGQPTQLMAVVKADGYGLGAVALARTALRAGASWLAVARIEEGVVLRKAGIKAPILNLACTLPEEAELAVEYRIRPTVVDLATARAFSGTLPANARYPIHLKVDSGLSRFGVQPSELLPLLKNLELLDNLVIEGVFSHFATADESDDRFAREQLDRFKSTLRSLEVRGVRPSLRHAANSAATVSLPESRLDLVRVGIMLSGHYPSAEVPRLAGIAPAVSLRSRLARVYELPSGASVGYGRTFVTTRPTLAGLVPLGYADGLPRAASNRASVLVNGCRAPLIGRVSMDQCVVDLTELTVARPGDEVVLFGCQAGAEITLDEFATWGDTIVHEALCRVGPRVPRRYRGAASDSREPGAANGKAELNGHAAFNGAYSGPHRA